jgi:2',5'-phosphodiesterase
MVLCRSRFWLCSRAISSLQSVRASAARTLVPSPAPQRSFTSNSQQHQQQQGVVKKPATASASPSFLVDRKLEHLLERFRGGNANADRNRQRKAGTHPSSNRTAGNGTSTTAKAAAPSSALHKPPSRPTLQRKMQGRNKIAVLHPQDSHVVTLDLSIEAPPRAAPPATPETRDKVTPTTVVKSMAREEQEAAAKTLDRIRMLFSPPRPKGQAATRQSREELLATCPSVRVYCRASEVDKAAEEDTVDLEAPGTTAVRLPHAKDNPDSSTSGDAEVLYRELNTELPNGVFWKYARVLMVDDTTAVRILYNVPTITAIAGPGIPYVGLPLACANVALLFAKEENVCYEWCVVGDKPVTNNSGGKAEEAKGAEGAVCVVGTEPTFTPTAELLGKPLLLRVSLDSATGLWTELQLPDVVRPLPPPVARWQATPTPLTAPAFRVITYNILYDDFCTSKSSKTKIYPFATDDVLDLENRKVRIAQELLAYHADLLCLQECGRDVFQSYLLPVMKAAGYDGVYMNKNGTVKEGCGFLFRSSRYTLVDSTSIPLNYATLLSRHAGVAERVGTCPELKEALSAVTTIGARLVLLDVESKKEVVVGNTHLFFHANACHIRILQAYMLMHWLSDAAAEAGGSITQVATSDKTAPRVRPVVLCGDFNCTHPTGAYRLLTTGQVESDHHSWDKGRLFWWGCSRLLGYDAERLEELLGEEAVLPQATVARKDFKRKKKTFGASASPATASKDAEAGEDTEATTSPVAMRGDDHVVEKVFCEALHAPPLHLQDAYQRTDPSLPWTNYTLTFREVIDYVFFSRDSVEVLRTVPIPPESELAENFALPNRNYPSDHVALIADLSFKE